MVKIENVKNGWFLFFVVFILALFLALVIPSAKSQVTYDVFPFDRSANSTIRDNVGTVTNLVNTSVSCIKGNCYVGDGNGYITYANKLVLTNESFSIRCVVNTTSSPDTSSYRKVFGEFKETGGYEGYGYGVTVGVRYDMKPFINGFARNYWDGAITLNDSQQYVIVWAHNRSGGLTTKNLIWVNGVKTATSCEGGSYCNELMYSAVQATDKHFIGGYSGDAAKYRWNGTFDECKVWQDVITDEIALQDYTNLTTVPGPALATITNIGQSPSNATILNIAESGVNISADIENANVSSILLSLKLNGTIQYVNGSQINPNKTIPYNTTLGINYVWKLSENDLLSYTTNIPIDVFYSTVHSSNTLSSPNQWLKMEFLNMTYNKPLNFVELYDNNASATVSNAEYYYCNSSYTSGNPTNNNNCVLFYSISDNSNYSHIHSSNSKHHILPLGINSSNGKVLGIQGTPTCYILKRGTTSGVNYFYINVTSRPSAAQYSSNNGVLWSNLALSPDSHIHMASNTDVISYRIQANNTPNLNTTFSSWSTDYPDLPLLSPIPVTIYLPLYSQIFYNNETMLINHSQSFSQSGQSIVNYTYWYASYGESSFTYIGKNDYPTSTFPWSLFLVAPGYYYVRVYVSDNLGMYSYTDSGVFQVVDRFPPSSSNTNVTGIETVLRSLEGGVTLIPLVLIYAIFMVLGYHMITHGNTLSGMLLYIISLGFDFLFIGWIFDKYNPVINQSSYYGKMVGIAMIFICFVWIIFKIGSLIMFRVSAYKYQYTNVKRMR